MEGHDGARPVQVSIHMSEEAALDLVLVFTAPISDLDFTINNRPSPEENSRIEKFCQPVVGAIVSSWIEDPGINGIHSISIKRHLIQVHRADSRLFAWEVIIAPLLGAIREAYQETGAEFIRWSAEAGEYELYVEPVDQLYQLSRSIYESVCEDSEESPIPAEERA